MASLCAYLWSGFQSLVTIVDSLIPQTVIDAVHLHSSNIVGCAHEIGLAFFPAAGQQFYWIRRRYGISERRLLWPLLNLCGQRISVFAHAPYPDHSVKDLAWEGSWDFDDSFDILYTDDIGDPIDWYYRVFDYRFLIRWDVLVIWLQNHAWGWELVPVEIVHEMLEVDCPSSKFCGWQYDYQYFPHGPPSQDNPFLSNWYRLNPEGEELNAEWLIPEWLSSVGQTITAVELVNNAERVHADVLIEEVKCAICYSRKVCHILNINGNHAGLSY